LTVKPFRPKGKTTLFLKLVLNLRVRVVASRQILREAKDRTRYAHNTSEAETVQGNWRANHEVGDYMVFEGRLVLFIHNAKQVPRLKVRTGAMN
jgi:hypothetical protein